MSILDGEEEYMGTVQVGAVVDEQHLMVLLHPGWGFCGESLEGFFILGAE